VFPTVMG